MRRARRPRRRRGSAPALTGGAAGRDPGRVDLGGEGRPVRGRQRQLPGRATRRRNWPGSISLSPPSPPPARWPWRPPSSGSGRWRRWRGCCWRRRSLVAVAAAAPCPGVARSAAGAADPGAPLQHRVGDHALAGRGGLVARPRAPPRHGLDLSRHGPGRLRRRGRPSSACSTSAPRTALLAGTLAPMLYAALWLAASNRALGHGGADGSMPTDEPAAVATGPAGTWSALFAHPLGPPLGAASFMLTFVWVLTEFLCFARYQQMVDPDALPEFLARIYALLQLAEFACIALFAGPVTRWVPPVWRSVDLPRGRALEPAVDESGGERALGRGGRTRLHGIGLERAVRSDPCQQLRGGPDAAASKAAGRDRGGLLSLGDGGRRHGASGRLPGPERRRAAARHGDRHHRRHAVRRRRRVHRHHDRAVAADGPRADGGGRCRHPPAPSWRAARAALAPWARRVRAAGIGCWPAWAMAPLPTGSAAGWIARIAARCGRYSPRRAAATGTGRCPGSRSCSTAAAPSCGRWSSEAVLSLPLRRLFLPFQPALRRRYLP